MATASITATKAITRRLPKTTARASVTGNSTNATSGKGLRTVTRTRYRGY